MDIDMMECEPKPRALKTNSASAATASAATATAAATTAAANPAAAKRESAPTGGGAVDLDESLDDLPELPSIAISDSPPVERGFKKLDAPGTLWGTSRKSDARTGDVQPRASGGDEVELEELEELVGTALGATPLSQSPLCNKEPSRTCIERLSVEDEMDGDAIPELGGDHIPELGADGTLEKGRDPRFGPGSVDAASPQPQRAPPVPVHTPEPTARQLLPVGSNHQSPDLGEAATEGVSTSLVQPPPQQGDSAGSLERSSASTAPAEEGAARDGRATSSNGQKSAKEGKGRLRFGRRA